MIRKIKPVVGISVFIVLSLLSGCATSVNTVKVDETTAAQLRDEVTVYDSKKIGGLEYITVQQIHATVCGSRENAMDQLRYIARSAGANGITKIKCDSLLGPSFMSNCLTTVMCEAVAIRVGTKAGEAEKAEAEKVEKAGDKQVMSKDEGKPLQTGGAVVTSQAMGHAVNIRFADLKWEKIVPELGDRSSEIAILRVDPKTQATQLLIRVPKDFHVPMHWHTANETHTIIKGTFIIECEGKRETLGQGSWNYVPSKMVHEAWTKPDEEALLFITVDSAWDINWVNPPKPSDFLSGRKQ